MDSDRSAGLDRAHALALEWLASLADRPVPPRLTTEGVAERLDPVLPDGPTDAATIVDELAAACDPGLTAIPGGRFFGFVIGGTHPRPSLSDWLVSAWDQNSGLRMLTPAHSAVEDLTETWLLDLLGLPPGSAVGFVTGGTMANFTCLAAARDEVLRRHGWDVADPGAGRLARRTRPRRRRAARHHRPGAALPRPRLARAGRGRRPGPDRARRPRRRPRRR